MVQEYSRRQILRAGWLAGAVAAASPLLSYAGTLDDAIAETVHPARGMFRYEPLAKNRNDLVNRIRGHERILASLEGSDSANYEAAKKWFTALDAYAKEHIYAPFDALVEESVKDLLEKDKKGAMKLRSQWITREELSEKYRYLIFEYASKDIPVVSNASAHRHTDDVPMVIPEINHGHLRVIDEQRKRHGWKNGFVLVKPNCSIQSYIAPMHALMEAG